MRKIICVCRSVGKSRKTTAKILDRYFDRIGDRTWRGVASNACLDRVASELRKSATRSSSVAIHDIKSDAKSQRPLAIIGSGRKFSNSGISPISVKTSRPVLSEASVQLRRLTAPVSIAALFHDMGKASRMFQDKLARAMKGSRDGSDRVRHELVSALIWDEIAGDCSDHDLPGRLSDLTPDMIDLAWKKQIGHLSELAFENASSVNLKFMKHPESLTGLIGLLILTHHRLPETGSDFTSIWPEAHINQNAVFAKNDLELAPGIPFWHEDWFFKCLLKDVHNLSALPAGVDVELRDALILADHHGSAVSVINTSASDREHLANTRDNRPADSLSTHTRRVWSSTKRSVELISKWRESWPAIAPEHLPASLRRAGAQEGRFGWQGRAFKAAAEVAKSGGGFFGVIMAGTGTGKTRAAPAILAAATQADPDPSRRSFRMTLGLGLRTLASQSLNEYIKDIGLNQRDTSLFVGRKPLTFSEVRPEFEGSGRENTLVLPEWLEMRNAGYDIPEEGTSGEDAWLAGLSLNTDRLVPAWARFVAENMRHPDRLLRLLSTPVAIGTIDHIMAAASPDRSQHIPQSLRIGTSDLILDEIDQYGDEDIAAIARLIYRCGVAGRRVIIMSATTPEDVSEVLFQAYRSGWKCYSELHQVSDSISSIAAGDCDGAVFCSEDTQNITEVLKPCFEQMAKALLVKPPSRLGEISRYTPDWDGVIENVDQNISALHDQNNVDIDGFRVSVGAIRITRIQHTTALAMQLPAGGVSDGRLRLKICLHSQLPRVQREWIEGQLAVALNRKNGRDTGGIKDLLERFGVLQRARENGMRDIEIVVICSPVIETGNDIDLDWGILDVASMRSISQFAGRIQRHRNSEAGHENLVVLPRSLIAMSEGQISYPGVQTRPHRDTEVAMPFFDLPEDLLMEKLAGPAISGPVTALPFLRKMEDIPLQQAEEGLRKTILNPSITSAARQSAVARLSRRMGRLRKFRRNDRGRIELFLSEDHYGRRAWHIDCAPGQRASSPMKINPQDITISAAPAEEWLFSDAFSCGLDDVENSDRIERVSLIEIDDPSRGVVSPKLHINTMTGVTRGDFDDLISPFGRSASS